MDIDSKIDQSQGDFFAIKISEDSMSVFLDLHPPSNDSAFPTAEIIIEKIIALGVKAKIDEMIVRKTVAIVKKTKKAILDVKVAEGKTPIKGVDGWLEYAISKDDSDKASHKDKKKVDFHKTSSIVSVEKDQTIAVIHPPVPGEDGFDVFGQVLPFEEGKPAKVDIGPNMCISEENENQVCSSIDGFIDFYEHKVSVKDTHVVGGDIDYHSGNIIGNGSVKVTGNVKNGFELKLKHNVEVGGYIGDAIIEAGENVIARGGFLGTGTGVMTAGGDIDVKFIQNQKVYCRASLNFVRECVHSEIYVRDKIIGKGQHAAIIGGFAIAGEGIEVYALGNEYGTNTTIEVGYDYEIKNILIQNRVKLNDIRKELKRIDTQIMAYTEMKRLNKREYEKLKILASRHKELSADIVAITVENRQLIKKVRLPSSSFVKVANIIYPGVKIIINRKQLLITEQLRSKTFALSDDNVVVAT